MQTSVIFCFSGVVEGYQQSYFGPGTGTIWMNDVRCRETELRLSDCKHEGWKDHSDTYDHDDDVGVVCKGNYHCYFNRGSCWH